MAARKPKVVDEIVRGTLTFEQGEGITTITGGSIEAESNAHLQICFNGRTYHAQAGPYGDFRVVVPAFEGDVEVWTADKMDHRLVAQGVA